MPTTLLFINHIKVVQIVHFYTLSIIQIAILKKKKILMCSQVYSTPEPSLSVYVGFNRAFVLARGDNCSDASTMEHFRQQRSFSNLLKHIFMSGENVLCLHGRFKCWTRVSFSLLAVTPSG